MKSNPEIPADSKFIAHCGLYCAACPRYLEEKCQGCHDQNHNPSWCEVKPCNLENNYVTCADCRKVKSVAQCKKFNPLLIRFGEFISRTSRKDGIKMIQEQGSAEFANHMAKNKLVSIKK